MGRKQGDSVVGVYMLHNQETGEAYIGSGVLNMRRNAHFSHLRNNKHQNNKLQAAFNANPNFDFVGVEVEGMDRTEARDEALRIEASLIIEQADNPLLLNLMRNDVGNGSYPGHTVDTVERISEKLVGRWQDPQWRESVVAAQRAGKAAMTEEQRAEIARSVSESLKQSYAERGGSPTKGQTRSQEFRENNSRNISSLWQDPEYRASQMASRPKGKRNDNGLSKAVEVDGIIYPTKTAAAEAHGITKQGVSYRLTSGKFANWNSV